MATVIPVDEFITDEWYPGFKPGYTHAPWYINPVQTFRKEDEENFGSWTSTGRAGSPRWG